MKKIVVVPDLHGREDLLVKVLKKFDESHEIIQLGDCIDKGPKSFETLKLMKKTVEENRGVMLKGNHEDFFLSFLENYQIYGDSYFFSGGKKTLKSFLGKEALKMDYNEMAKKIKKEFREEILFLENLPLFIERGNWVFSHSGLDLKLENWRGSSKEKLIWQDHESFAFIKNRTEKKIVVGHTITNKFHGGENYSPWVSNCNSKFFLDGNAMKTGELNLMIIDPQTDKFEFKKIK